MQWALQTANCIRLSIGCNSFLWLCHQWTHVDLMDVAINTALLTSIHDNGLSYFCLNFCWCIFWVLDLGIRNFRRNSSISGCDNTSFVIAKFSSVDEYLTAWTFQSLNMIIDKDTFSPYSDFFPLLSEELRAGRQSNNSKRLPSQLWYYTWYRKYKHNLMMKDAFILSSFFFLGGLLFVELISKIYLM